MEEREIGEEREIECLLVEKSKGILLF